MHKLYELAVLFLNVFPGKMSIYVLKMTFTGPFIAVLFIMAEIGFLNWNKPITIHLLI